MKIILLSGLCLATFLITALFETAHDYWVSKDTKRLYRDKWKFYGQATLYPYLALLTAFDIYLTDWYGLFLFPIQILVFWITHDAFMGIRFHKGPYHLGSGKWDTAMLQIFWSGRTFFWVRILWLSLLILIYLAL